MEEDTASTWELGVGAADTWTPEPARIDPATLSARIAGMTMVRLMVMIPPWHLRRSEACFMAPAAHEAHLNYLK
jgi:hypothetical protein